MYGPAGVVNGVSPGRRPFRHVTPPSVEVAQPIAAAPPPKFRPTWNTDTTVFPTEKLSGSAIVACCPRTPAPNGSTAIGRGPTAAVAGAAAATAANAMSRRRRTSAGYLALHDGTGP